VSTSNKAGSPLTLESLQQALKSLEDDTINSEPNYYYCPHVKAFRTGGCKECVELHRDEVIEIAKDADLI